MKALCVNSYSDLQDLVAGKVPTVTATMVDRLVCDNLESGLQKLVPYVVFYNMDVNAGKLKFIQYLRPGKVVEGSEEKAPGASSIGFGVPIHNVADILSQEHIVGEDGTEGFTMSLQDIIQSSINAGLREFQEQVGFDFIENLGRIVDPNKTAFFQSEAPFDELKTMAGIAIPVAVTSEQFELIKTKATLRPEHIEKLDTLGINIDLIVEQMDITPTINHVIEELVTKYNLEPWSTMMFNFIARSELHAFMKDINYNDIVALVHAKAAAMKEIAQQEIASQAAAAAQPAGEAVMDSAAPAEEIREEVREDKPAA